MQTLFTYYSLEGNCRALSLAMAQAVGGKSAELVPADDTMPRGVVMKYLVGGKRALMKETIALKPLAVDPAAFDLVFVGGPVWAGGMTPEVRSFLAGRDWGGRRLALFAMHRGGPGKATEAMAKLATEHGGEVVGATVFVDLRRKNPDQTLENAVAWAKEMIGRAAPAGGEAGA